MNNQSLNSSNIYNNTTTDIKAVKTELRQIRDQINKLLDQLDYNPTQNVPEVNDKTETKGKC